MICFGAVVSECNVVKATVDGFLNDSSTSLGSRYIYYTANEKRGRV